MSHFLTGRKATIDGFTYRDDDGVEHDEVFLCVGASPYVPGTVVVQDIVDRDITMSIDPRFIRPLPES